MAAVALGLVILSGCIHSVWNLFAKKSKNKTVFLWYCQLAAVVIFLPVSIYEFHNLYTVAPVGWGFMLLSMALHGFYVLLLAKTYATGDLSQAYPIMRGISPLLVPLIGVSLLEEGLKWIGWAGVLFIVIGILVMGDFRAGKIASTANKTMLLAISVGIMITGYTVVDKVALKHFSPVLLNEATNIGNLMALSWIALRSQELVREWKLNWKTILLGGLLAPGGYILFLRALEMMPVSQLAPMREIGTVFGTLLGIFVLHEPQGKVRIIGSILITAGIILLAQ